jgi:peptidoglycan/xylan/chitin deacetylase (PgdA/CDA1 family)
VGRGLFTLGVVEWLRRRRARRHGAPLILRYHSVGGSRWLRPQLVTSPEHFGAHVRYVSRRYRVLPLDAIVEAFTGGPPVPPGAVAITFDDGYRDNYRIAWPILRRNRCPATVFVIVEPLETGAVPWPQRLYGWLRQAQRGSFECDLQGPEAGLARVARALGLDPAGVAPGCEGMLRWEEVRELAADGVTIGSHTMTHPSVATLHPDRIAWELETSRRILEGQLERPVALLAYPFGKAGDVSEATLAAARAAGYVAAVTTVDGVDRGPVDPFLLRRVKVLDEPVWRFAFRLLAAQKPSRLASWVLGERRSPDAD